MEEETLDLSTLDFSKGYMPQDEVDLSTLDFSKGYMPQDEVDLSTLDFSKGYMPQDEVDLSTLDFSKGYMPQEEVDLSTLDFSKGYMPQEEVDLSTLDFSKGYMPPQTTPEQEKIASFAANEGDSYRSGGESWTPNKKQETHSPSGEQGEAWDADSLTAQELGTNDGPALTPEDAHRFTQFVFGGTSERDASGQLQPTLSRLGGRAAEEVKSGLKDLLPGLRSASVLGNEYWKNATDDEVIDAYQSGASSAQSRVEQLMAEGVPYAQAIRTASIEHGESMQGGYKKAEAFAEKKWPSDKNYQESSGKFEDIVGGVSRSLPGMVATGVNAPVGFGVMATQMAGQGFAEGEGQGNLSQERNALASWGSALAQAPLESAGNIFQLGKLKRFFGNNPAGVRLLDLAQVAGAEGMEEVLQGIPEDIANYWLKNPGASLQDAAVAVGQDPEFPSREWERGWMGAAGGVLLHGAGAAVGNAYQRAKKSLSFVDTAVPSPGVDAGSLSDQGNRDRASFPPDQISRLNGTSFAGSTQGNHLSDEQLGTFLSSTNSGMALAQTLADLRAAGRDDIADNIRINSANTGEHAKGSKHYSGEAVDLGIRALSPEDQAVFAQAAKKNGLAQTVNGEPWHFGYVGNGSGPQSFALGSVTGKYESGSDYAMVSQGDKWGDPGGVSYGRYQIPTRELPNFAATVGESLPADQNMWPAWWKDRSQDQAFRAKQDAYIRQNNYEPVRQFLADRYGIDADQSPMLAEAVFAAGNAHGATGAKNVIQRALEGKDLTGAKTEDIIKAIYAERMRPGENGTGLAYWKSSPANIQQNIARRLQNEAGDILGLPPSGAIAMAPAANGPAPGVTASGLTAPQGGAANKPVMDLLAGNEGASTSKAPEVAAPPLLPTEPNADEQAVAGFIKNSAEDAKRNKPADLLAGDSTASEPSAPAPQQPPVAPRVQGSPQLVGESTLPPQVEQRAKLLSSTPVRQLVQRGAELGIKIEGTPSLEEYARKVAMAEMTRDEAVAESEIPWSRVSRALDANAHAAATSPLNSTPQPTQAQKSAGNYKKGHVRVQGLDISVENPAGSVRSGTDKDGKPWKTEMQHHYGYIKGTEGRDKDHLDVFLGPNAETSPNVYVVNQIDPKTGRFDEHKVMLGFSSPEEAANAYLSNYAQDWDGLESMAAMDMPAFKSWLRSGNTKHPAMDRMHLDAARKANADWAEGMRSQVKAETKADPVVEAVWGRIDAGSLEREARENLRGKFGPGIFWSPPKAPAELIRKYRSGKLSKQEAAAARKKYGGDAFIRVAIRPQALDALEQEIRSNPETAGRLHETYGSDALLSHLLDRGVSRKEATARRLDDIEKAYRRADEDAERHVDREGFVEYEPARYGQRDRQLFFQRAYHGSPRRDIERFDWETHRGTGEGVAAYGEGTYAAGNKKVGEYYRKELSGHGKYFSEGDAYYKNEDGFWEREDSYPMSRDHPLSIALDAVSEGKPRSYVEELVRDNPARWSNSFYTPLDFYDDIERGDEGQLYEVDIPDSNELLDWDKPLSLQPEGVLAAIEGTPYWKNLMAEQADVNKQAGYQYMDRENSLTGEKFYHMLEVNLGSAEEASKFLRSIGIPGHRYLDGMSRREGEGSHNYVIYDNDRISITEKFYHRAKRTGTKAPASPLPLPLKSRMVRSALDAATKKLPTVARSIDIYQSEDALPSGLRAEVEHAGLSGKFTAVYDPSTARISFVIDNIPDARAANHAYIETLLRHEGRHKFLDFAFGSPAMKRAWFRNAADRLGGEVDNWMRAHKKGDVEKNRIEAAEEVIVEWAKTGKVHNLVDKLLAKIAEWVRRVFNGLKLTKAEIRQLLARADAWLESDGFGLPEFIGSPRNIAPAYGRREPAPRFARKSTSDTKNDGKEAAAGETAKDTGPRRVPPAKLELPELVRLTKQIMGEYPGIFQRLHGRQVGVFRAGLDSPSEIRLKASNYIGVELGNGMFRSEAESEKFIQEILERHELSMEDVTVTDKAGAGGKREVHVYLTDPDYAARIMGHEIGHLVDFMPDKVLKRGNILGHIAGLKKYMNHYLAERPGGEPPLTPKDKLRLLAEARKLASGRSYEIQIEEEIEKLTGLSPEDILSIWRDSAARESLPRDLYNYVAGLSDAEKKSVMVAAMKGMIPEDLKRFAMVTKEKTGRVITKTINENATHEEVMEKFRELLRSEIVKRKLIGVDEVMEELKALSRWWDPFDPAADQKYTKYRHKPSELYGDALSVLLNAPDELASRAPKFMDAFFNYIDTKSDFRDAWTALQNSIKGGEVATLRVQSLREGFAKGDEAYRKLYEKDHKLLGPLASLFVDRFSPVYATATAPESRFAIEDAIYSGSRREGYMRDMYHKVQKVLEKAGLSSEDFGEFLFHIRVTGERDKMANPGGWTEKASGERLAEMQDQGKFFTASQVKALEDAEKSFREIRREEILAFMRESGMFNPELMRKMEESQTYATFDVFKHSLDGRYGEGVGAKIYEQVGTHQDITNPYTATLMKDTAMIGSILWNNAKKTVIEDMLASNPGAIEPARKRFNPGIKAMTFAEPTNSDQGMVAYMESGKVHAYYVQAEVAAAFRDGTPQDLKALGNVLAKGANGFRLLYTQLRPGFQLFNLIRDFRSLNQNLPGSNPEGRVLREYVRAIGPAFRSAFGVPDKTVREMERIGSVLSIFDPAGLEREDQQVERLYQGWGIAPKKFKINVWEPLDDFLTKVAKAALVVRNIAFKVGAGLERIPKVAGYTYLKKHQPHLSDAEIAHIVRSRAGSPAFLMRGKAHAVTNNIFLFSNAAIQGYRASFEAAKEDPRAYAWKALKWNLIPTVLKFAALYGLLGAGLKEIMNGIGEYDMANYNIIPLGKDAKGQSVYLRLPKDEVNRLAGGIMWKMLNAADPNKRQLSNISQLLDFAAGQIPSLAPFLTIPLTWGAFVTGHNPYDAFRGREILDDTTFKAGGVAAFKDLAKWTWNTAGGGIVYTFKRADDIDRLKGELGQVLGLPVVNDTIGRFIKVSNLGIREKIEGATASYERDKARHALDLREAVANAVNGKELDEKDIVALALGAKRLKMLVKNGIVKASNIPLLEALVKKTDPMERLLIIQQWKKMHSN